VDEDLCSEEDLQVSWSSSSSLFGMCLGRAGSRQSTPRSQGDTSGMEQKKVKELENWDLNHHPVLQGRARSHSEFPRREEIGACDFQFAEACSIFRIDNAILGLTHSDPRCL
jgi:hypothetical protein